MTKPAFITERGLDWYVKWTATFVALLHVYLTAHDVTPYYKYTGITTAALWTWIGVLWSQPNIIILNIIMMAIYIKGLFV